MNLERFQKYLEAKSPLGQEQFTWPLYGAGLDNLGKNGKPVKGPIPSYSGDELLMRIDAVSLCYTDLKEIDAGETHPRLIGRNLKDNPIIPGHEISFTVVGVGKNLQSEYKVGNRFTMQPDIWVDGKSIPFCFGMDGGYRQFAKIGKEVLKGDAGNYLIPVPDDMPYASSAITEPWACVEAAYRMPYRNDLRKGGRLLILGGKKVRDGYKLNSDWITKNPPAEIVLTNVPVDLKKQITPICNLSGTKLSELGFDSLIGTEQKYDDIFVLDGSAEVINEACKLMANFGVLAIVGEESAENPVKIDMGRLHYDATYFVGSTSLNLETAYKQTEPRVSLKPNGKTWILGAGGPMGRLHLQRAIESQDGPGLIVASEVTESRYDALVDFFVPFAEKYQKDLIIVNPIKKSAEYQKIMRKIKDEGGFDDIQIMVTIPAIISESTTYAGQGAVIDLFAGLKRGVTAEVDAGLINGPLQIRFVGHSGSGLDDQKAVVSRVISGQLKPELSVAAVGGINQIADGIKAMKNWVFPGKIVIYPHVLDFPLTAIGDLEEIIPEIAPLLGERKTWSLQAEQFFLDRELSNE
jgi:threonine dehydrogenase-like Zn-dependent dehydrogenase